LFHERVPLEYRARQHTDIKEFDPIGQIYFKYGGCKKWPGRELRGRASIGEPLVTLLAPDAVTYAGGKVRGIPTPPKNS
jgi:hypothetical protein